jgi:hypothetical protein
MKPALEIRQPTTKELLTIIRAEARRGRRAGIHIAHSIWRKRAEAQALHDHYTGSQSRAAKRRIAAHRLACAQGKNAKAAEETMRRLGHRTSRLCR